jgi:hypothetical protein
MADLPLSDHGEQGAPAVAALRAAAALDTLPNDGNTLVLVRNADAGARVVTFTASGKCNQGFLHDMVISVAAGEDGWCGPFPTQRFGGSVAISYDATANTTVAGSKITPAQSGVE